jgi:hypothetical protein
METKETLTDVVLQPQTWSSACWETLNRLVPKLAIVGVLAAGLAGLFIFDKWKQDYEKPHFKLTGGAIETLRKSSMPHSLLFVRHIESLKGRLYLQDDLKEAITKALKEEAPELAEANETKGAIQRALDEADHIPIYHITDKTDMAVQNIAKSQQVTIPDEALKRISRSSKLKGPNGFKGEFEGTAQFLAALDLDSLNIPIEDKIRCRELIPQFVVQSADVPVFALALSDTGAQELESSEIRLPEDIYRQLGKLKDPSPAGKAETYLSGKMYTSEDAFLKDLDLSTTAPAWAHLDSRQIDAVRNGILSQTRVASEYADGDPVGDLKRLILVPDHAGHVVYQGLVVFFAILAMVGLVKVASMAIKLFSFSPEQKSSVFDEILGALLKPDENRSPASGSGSGISSLVTKATAILSVGAVTAGVIVVASNLPGPRAATPAGRDGKDSTSTQQSYPGGQANRGKGAGAQPPSNNDDVTKMEQLLAELQARNENLASVLGNLMRSSTSLNENVGKVGAAVDTERDKINDGFGELTKSAGADRAAGLKNANEDRSRSKDMVDQAVGFAAQQAAQDRKSLDTLVKNLSGQYGNMQKTMSRVSELAGDINETEALEAKRRNSLEQRNLLERAVDTTVGSRDRFVVSEEALSELAKTGPGCVSNQPGVALALNELKGQPYMREKDLLEDLKRKCASLGADCSDLFKKKNVISEGYVKQIVKATRIAK